MKKCRVLIVDDNPRFSAALKDCFSAYAGIERVDACQTSEAGMAFLRETPPDVAIIDMLMPGMDGAELITQCRERGIAKNTKFVAVSPLASEEIVKLSQRLEVAYFVAMPMPAEKICRAVARIMEVAPPDAGEGASPAAKQRQLDREQIIMTYLHILGVSPHVNGYRCLKAAIEYSVENCGRDLRVTRDIYPAVARACNSTPKRVERNIRTAIDRAWFYGSLEMQHKLFGYTVNDDKGRPTNKECIAMLADRTIMRERYN